jgi:hypothetical protein
MAYAGSQAQSGRGSTLSIGATPTLIGEIKNVPFTSGKWATADVTNFNSGNDAEFITTIRDNGSVTIEGNRVSGDAGQTAVEAAYDSGEVASFTLTLPKTAAQVTKGDTYTFNALVLSRDFTVDVTKEIDYKVELKISGAVTFAAGS